MDLILVVKDTMNMVFVSSVLSVVKKCGKNDEITKVKMIESREFLNLTRDRLPRAKAEFLLSTLLERERYELYLNPEPVSFYTHNRFIKLIELWEKGYPLQYLTRQADFLDLKLFVDRRVFIPRPETEELIEVLSQLNLKPGLILDIGTGSGNIAIGVARLYRGTEVIATDISPDALEVARINITRHSLLSKVKLLRADLFPYDRGIDLIISNPPYIKSSHIPHLPISVKYEPIIALNGGEDGLSVIRRILLEAPKFLRSEGVLAMEISPEQKSEIEEIIPSEFKNILFEKDLRGDYRFCILFKR